MIPISRTFFNDTDYAAVVEPLRCGWVVQGERVRAFESGFSAFTGHPHAVAASSCTTALHLALRALGIGAGDEVLVPAFTWISTANAVVHAGAVPVFVDIDLATFNVDVAALEARLTPRTRAIIPVHLFGYPAEMDAIMALARQHDLRVLEDAACGFGTRYRGTHVGAIGDAGCFSFHPRKAITTGEGGMITTRSAEVAARCRSLRDHGAVRRETGGAPFLLPEFPDCGFNYRLTDIQGALGCSQLAKADTILAARRQLAARYDARLAECDWLRRPVRSVHADHGFQSYVCLYAPETPTLQNRARLREERNALMSHLEAQGIGTRQGTHSVPHTRYYAERFGLTAQDCPQSLLAESLSLALPIFPGMTEVEVDTVVEALAGAFASRAASPRAAAHPTTRDVAGV